ncbi:cobyric acid synthase [Calderihabitans maritimus]|uniref:Cobyric acid synthase n=1 Tax=Calderihabitans maritimus TaxID=1246530 RepID=A0A1Z5HPR5_9FIRM|nr:cobyric acid synthase [Calderihabitans maritimus]GAW91519.1 cobyric acid synthase CobQ [Calderihabitans maritimus]
MAKTIMLQGTSSNVGKSVLATGLCRILYRRGLKVVPFKAQNMALNSFVTRQGGEMGRAQVVQAEAAGLEPQVEMNPILLKPTGNASSQVILLGKPIGNMSAKEYHLDFNLRALEVIENCLRQFHRDYDVIVIEGAGSPAEVNLKHRDIANMRIAKLARAPVVLVADIDRGGALASVVGTLELLEPEERELVAGIIINKFRGDLDLLRPALDFLEKKTGKKVFGVVPYFRDFHIPEEDSVVLEEELAVIEGKKELDIAVLRVPRISNFTDFDPLAQEEDVTLRYVFEPRNLGEPDLIILPGSKNTIEDMIFLWESGLASAVRKLAKQGVPVIGICGGYQMLGRKLIDPDNHDSFVEEVEGLGLLDTVTVFEADKITRQVEAEAVGNLFLGERAQGHRITGYEIHMGRTRLEADLMPAFRITRRGQEEVDLPDGAVRSDGRVWGTYIHGLFDNDVFRRTFLDVLRENKGLQKGAGTNFSAYDLRQQAYEQLADLLEKSLDLDKLLETMGINYGT